MPHKDDEWNISHFSMDSVVSFQTQKYRKFRSNTLNWHAQQGEKPNHRVRVMTHTTKVKPLSMEFASI